MCQDFQFNKNERIFLEEKLAQEVFVYYMFGEKKEKKMDGY